MVTKVERVVVPIGDLVLDWDLHPRGEIVQSNLEQMIEALRAGATFPPVLADRETRIVVDGFHRIHAYKEVYGEDAHIPTILKDYGSRENILLETTRINNAHGQKLTEKDRERVFRIAADMKITAEDVAAALAIRPSTITTSKPRSIRDLKPKKNSPAWSPRSGAPSKADTNKVKIVRPKPTQEKEKLVLDAGYMAQQLLILIKTSPPADETTTDKLLALKKAIEEVLT